MGDGVYAEDVGHAIRLTTENGVSVQNEVFLEPEVLEAVIGYRARINEHREELKRIAEIKYPATQIVHCPTGPEPCCDKHAEGLVAIHKSLGCHVICSIPDTPQECNNCVNEAKDK